MTHSPNSAPPPEPARHSSPRSRRWRRIALGLGIATLITGTGAIWYGWKFVHEQLSPLVEDGLSKSMNRPVRVGSVERVSLTHLRLGPSSIPATATDADHASVPAIEVRFDLLRILMTRNLNLDVTLENPELYLDQDADGIWLKTQIQPQEPTGPVKTDLEILRVKDAQVTLLPKAKAKDARSPVNLSQIDGTVRLFDQSQRFVYELAGQSTTGGNFRITGETRHLSKEPIDPMPLATDVQIRGQNFAVAEIDRLLALPGLELPTGQVDGSVSLQFRPDRTLPYLAGSARFKAVTLKLAESPQPLTQATGELRLQDTMMRLNGVKTRFGQVPLQVNGTVDLNQGINLTAKMAPTALPQVFQTLQIKVPVPTRGEVTAELKVSGPLEKPVLTGIARNTQPLRLDQVDVDRFSARFLLDTAAQTLTISDLQATPTVGGQVTGGGTIKLVNHPQQLALSFQAIAVPADAIARTYSGDTPLPVKIGAISAQVEVTGMALNPEIQARWQAPNATYAGTGEVRLANGVVSLRNSRFNVAGGTLTADATAASGRWQATLAGAGIPLKRFSPDLRGLFSGQFEARGTLASFSPSNIRAQGEARFSEGIAVVGNPLTAQVQWDGQKLIVERATAPGLTASGAIFARLEGAGAPEIAALDLNVRTTGYSLRDFTLPTPVPVAYGGQADFVGRVTGTPTAPKVTGDLALRQLSVNQVAFEPLMRGTVSLDRGVRLNLNGRQDQITATLDAAYRPVSFVIRRDQAIARGMAQGELLLVDAENIPLSLLAPPPVALMLPISGQLNGKFALNLNTFSGSGDVAIAQPTIGTFHADRFGGNLQVRNGVATLTGAQLQRGKTLLQLDGSAALLAPDPKVQGTIKVAQGRLQDLLELLQIFELQDLERGLQIPTYGSATDLQTAAAGLTDASVLDQMRRLSEIKTLLSQVQAKRAAAPLPDLRELEGVFTANMTIAGSLKRGIKADFTLQGQEWKWGPYVAKQVVAAGNFQDGTLTLLPVRLQSDQSIVSFSGQVSPEKQSGQLRVENFPVEAIAQLVPLPARLQGKLNATATLGGSVKNPQVVGELHLTDGAVNGTKVEQGRGAFRYANARLDFGSNVFISGPEPISVLGSLPLPLAGVKPDSDRISLDLNIRNEGLAFLNVITDQVSWEKGQGSVNVQIRGTAKQPVATGIVSVKDATLKARALPDPLTDVSGVIRFDFDRARVENLQGQFSQGRIAANGVIPIAAPMTIAAEAPAVDQPLTVALEKIRLNLKGIYQGGVDGNVKVLGTLLNPVLSGGIQLANGQILLSDPQEQAIAATPGSAGPEIEFDNLKLQVGDRVQVTLKPLLNFVARGDLLINGSLNDIQPQGTIRLNAGQVNLFTTQFFLERGYPQTATFEPQRGLDPLLDVRLQASVSEVTRTRLPSTANPSEVLDVPSTATGFGSLQSVRVQATIKGPASQLAENLVLSSSPPRQPSEIVALIGGSFVNTFGRGDSALGLANLAGSALLTNIQTVISNALGLTQFRIFPTYVSQDGDGNQRDSGSTSTLGVGAEVGVDITRALSLSVLKLLTSSDPAQFSLRYRVNDQILLRGSSNFSGDNRGVIEYEARF